MEIIYKKMRVIFVTSALILFLVFLENAEGKMNFQQLENMAKGPKKSCQKSTECPQELLEAGKNGQFSPVREFQCFFKCIFDKMKVMKNDQISWPAMNQQLELLLNPELAERFAVAIEACQSKAISEDMCEATYQFAVCLWEHDSSLYFLS
ncbi:uncharacterized protein LOC117168511 [Belonocnema kinseyi]|uniref:uncharacterized protein LOC117168511 n=1 Tax=Belonocnema kinseyi TaxID=2817044 RepID=UPI00143D1B9E|nr:uncharacterized protein LOC117168511 [Belonocnema kinseyi]